MLEYENKVLWGTLTRGLVKIEELKRDIKAL